MNIRCVMSSPTLSVITITFNDSQGLARTIDSLKPLQGGDLSWQHIIVDSSPDENLAVIHSLPSHWPLTHLRVPAQGIFTAMNTGVGAVEGQYVWFLNGGDEAKAKENLFSVLHFLNQHPDVDMVCSGVDLFRDGKFMYSHQPSRFFLKNILGSCSLCHQGIIYRRRALEKVGPYSTQFKTGGDYEYHFRCYLKGLNVKTLSKKIARYDTGGISSRFQLTFSDFAAIHRSLRPQLPAWMNMANAMIRPVEYARVSGLKWLAQSPLAPVLRPLWLKWNRLKVR